MLTGLEAAPGATVVMAAGISSESKLLWRREQGYHDVVVSKLLECQFDPSLYPPPPRGRPRPAERALVIGKRALSRRRMARFGCLRSTALSVTAQ